MSNTVLNGSTDVLYSTDGFPDPAPVGSTVLQRTARQLSQSDPIRFRQVGETFRMPTIPSWAAAIKRNTMRAQFLANMLFGEPRQTEQQYVRATAILVEGVVTDVVIQCVRMSK